MSFTLIAVLGTYLMCWQGYKLRERLSGLGHAGILVSLVSTLANAAIARVSETHPHSLLTGQYISLIEHVFVAGSCLGLYLLRLGVEEHTLRDRAVIRTIAGGMLFSCTLATIVIAAITQKRLLSPTPASYREPLGFLYAFGAGTYYGAIMFTVAAWMWRYVRDHQPPVPAATRVGMRIAAIGLFGIAALCFGRAFPIAVVFLGGSSRIAPPWVLGTISAVAFPLVFIGLSYPLLVSRWAAYRAWKARRVTCDQARVLWRTCLTAYPEIELPPSGLRERVRLFISNHHMLARLVTESFDALAKLLVQDAPVNTPAGQAAEHHLREAVRRYDDNHPVTVANLVAPAVVAGLIDAEGVPQQPETAIEDDTELVIALATELRTLDDSTRTIWA